MNESDGNDAKPAESRPERVAVLSPAASKRVNATVIGMFIATGITVITVIPFLLIGLHPNSSYRPEVNSTQIANEYRDQSPFALVVPPVPDGWYTNAARLEHDSTLNVTTWYIGYVVNDKQFVSLTQTHEPSSDWLNKQVGRSVEGIEDTRQVGNHKWRIVQGDQDNDSFWVSDSGKDVFLLKGNASAEDFEKLAQGIN